MARRALEPENFPFFDYRRFTFSLGIVAGGSIWLSGNTGARFDAERRGMVVAGDLLMQARTIFDKMQAILAAAQCGLRDIYRMVRYVTPAALPDLGRLDEMQKEIFGQTPACSTVVVKSLLRPEALIEIEAVAGAGAGSAGGVWYPGSVFAADSPAAWTRVRDMLGARAVGGQRLLRAAEFVTPAVAWSKPDTLGAPAALRIGSPKLSESGAGAQIDIAVAPGASAPLLFVAAEGDPAADNVVDQLRDVYDRLRQRLSEAGVGFDSVVKTTEFITSAAVADYRKTADIRRKIFAPPYPAATGVICDRLPERRMLVAVEVVASLEAR